MKKVKLDELFEKPISGEWGKEDSGLGMATPVIRTANFVNSGKLNLDNVVYREIDKVKYESKILKFGDIIIEKSGGSPNQPVGRVVYFDIEDKDYFTNNFTSILRPKSGNHSRYIFYLMKYFYDSRKVLRFQNQTTGIINLKLADYLKNTTACLHDYKEQSLIVSSLDKIEHAIYLRNQQLAELKNLVKSRFNEMFGDPIINDKGWRMSPLSDLCNMIIGGGTPSKKNKDYYVGDIPWVTSKDMKSDDIYDSKIHINENAIENSSAKLIPENSVLLVLRSGILKHTLPVAINKVQVTINQDLKAFVPNEFCNSIFLQFALKASSKDILSEVRGVTADNIEFKSLKKRLLPLPPLSLQNEFADFVKEIDKSQFVSQKSLKLWRKLVKSSIIEVSNDEK